MALEEEVHRIQEQSLPSSVILDKTFLKSHYFALIAINEIKANFKFLTLIGKSITCFTSQPPHHSSAHPQNAPKNDRFQIRNMYY